MFFAKIINKVREVFGFKNEYLRSNIKNRVYHISTITRWINDGCLPNSSDLDDIIAGINKSIKGSIEDKTRTFDENQKRFEVCKKKLMDYIDQHLQYEIDKNLDFFDYMEKVIRKAYADQEEQKKNNKKNSEHFQDEPGEPTIEYSRTTTARRDLLNNDTYMDIDNRYEKLIEQVEFRDLRKTSSYLKQSNEFILRYSAYAFKCWNLVETICDTQKEQNAEFGISETWMPVVMEENRLHCYWFYNNLRLFKKKFQKFVLNKLNNIEIVEAGIDDLKEVYAKYEEDFPEQERKSFEHIEKMINEKKYTLKLLKHGLINDIIGYAFVYEVSDPNVLWLDYMSIDYRFQNRGFGTLLFNEISSCNENYGVFIEIEIPENQIQEKRINFYERQNAQKLTIDYKLPTEKGGYPMYLYFRQTPNSYLLSKAHIKKAISSAFNYIHYDISRKDSILDTVLSSVDLLVEGRWYTRNEYI